MRTCAAGLPAGAAALLLAFLKKTGFGERGVSNFTKSFSALSFFFKGLSAPGLPCVQGEKGGVTHRASCATPPRRKPRQGSSAVSQTRLTQQLQGAHRPFGARLPTPWRPAALLPQAQPAAWGSPRVLEPCFSAFKLRFCALQSPYESFAA